PAADPVADPTAVGPIVTELVARAAMPEWTARTWIEVSAGGHETRQLVGRTASKQEGAMAPTNLTGPVLWSVDARGVANGVLNRPEVNNAYDGNLIQGLLAAIDALGRAEGLRAIVIKGNGRHFQAGADLKWIDAVRTSSPQENVRVSRATA